MIRPNTVEMAFFPGNEDAQTLEILEYGKVQKNNSTSQSVVIETSSKTFGLNP